MIPFADSVIPGAVMFGGFVVVLFLLSIVVPGRTMSGVKLPDGSHVDYKLNGLPVFVILAVACFGGIFSGLVSLRPVVDHIWGIFFAANVFSFGASGYLLWKGRKNLRDDGEPKVSVSSSGEASVTGTQASISSIAKAYWMGAELNPTVFGVDVKMFSYRPSLMGLFVINVSFASVQFEQTGTLSLAMILYQSFTFIYLFNYFQFEYGMIYTWDIIAENFGFMLVWGDYSLVPFAYSMIGWTILGSTEPLPVAKAVLLCALFVFGLWVFRGSNEQKDKFKRDRNTTIWGKPAETIGGKILVSGFWGIGRKLNYSGEICVYFSWALLSGFQSIVPYLLPIWLLCLLTHRAWRDDKKCREKYGPLWEAYCARARFKMIPFVY